MEELQCHPLAEAFRPLNTEERKEMRQSLRECGLIDPIMLLDGQILDGKHRWELCIEEQIEPRFEDYSGKDPEAFVRGRNFARRHLNHADKVNAAKNLLKIHPEWSDRAIARKTGVSDKTVAARRSEANAEFPHYQDAESADVVGAGSSSETEAELAGGAGSPSEARGEEDGQTQAPDQRTPASDTEPGELREGQASIAEATPSQPSSRVVPETGKNAPGRKAKTQAQKLAEKQRREEKPKSLEKSHDLGISEIAAKIAASPITMFFPVQTILWDYGALIREKVPQYKRDEHARKWCEFYGTSRETW